MVQSSAYVQHFFCFLAVFFFFKAEHHVEETSGKKGRRRACGAKIKASDFDIKKFERESISHVGFGYIIQPGEVQIGLEFWSHNRWEICARQSRKFSIKFSSVAPRGVKNRINLYRWSWATTISWSPILDTLRKSSRKFDTVESSRRWPDCAGPKSQCIEMRIIYVNNRESSVHLGEHYIDNSVIYKNTNFEALKTLFGITQILILNQKHEIKHASTIEWHVIFGGDLLCHMAKVIKLSKANSSIQTQFFVWERCTDVRFPWWSGKITFNISRSPTEKRGFGEYNSWNSCDYWAETFGERTMLESELCESLSLNCLHRVFWSVEKLEYFKHALWWVSRQVVCFWESHRMENLFWSCVALVALWCADKRLFGRRSSLSVLWLFSVLQFCARRTSWHLMHGSSEKVFRTVSHTIPKLNTRNYLESTENHLSSSGIFSQVTLQCIFSKRFR